MAVLAARDAAAPVSLAEAKAYLRIEDNAEDALLSGLVRAASELCERFTGQVLLQREIAVTAAADGHWQRLAVTPVIRLVAAEIVGTDGAAAPPTGGAAELQIDMCGDGWVRVPRQDAGRRARLTVEAGLAPDWDLLPEALRQGIVRLTAHMFAHRDAAGEAEPPAAIAALWRPWRRMRLS